MARGWESKAVEAQQDEANTVRASRPPLTASEKERHRARAILQLARTQALGDLQRACAPAYRGMLEEKIADLDGKLALLD